VLGDGTDFHKWERDFLVPAGEKALALLSSKQRPLTNEELAAALSDCGGREKECLPELIELFRN
jgi:hypothetical protein